MEGSLLMDPFHSWATAEKFIDKLHDSGYTAVTILALEGALRIENEVERGQLEGARTKIRSFLSKWRVATKSFTYSQFCTQQYLFIPRSLQIFQEYEVPLFVDNYGEKRSLEDFQLEQLEISFDEVICHITHQKEAKGITKKKQFRASNNKNVLKGIWFGLDSEKSVYGSRRFSTTLGELRDVSSRRHLYLRQGEIVSYKREVNVILYLDEEPDEEYGLRKPTLQSAQELLQTHDVYVGVSIFVPKVYLPRGDVFDEVIETVVPVKHGPFCVKEKRSTYKCIELTPNEATDTDSSDSGSTGTDSSDSGSTDTEKQKTRTKKTTKKTGRKVLQSLKISS